MYTQTLTPTSPRLRAQLFAAALGALLASFVTLLSRCASAQPAADPYAEPPPISFFDLKPTEPLRDPIVRASIGMTALGVATALAGAGSWLSAEGHEVCGITGCVTSTSAGPERDAGTALVGLGGGLAVSGAISLLVSLGKPLPPEWTRDNEGVAVSGLVFAELGAGLLGSALTFGALSEDRPDFARGLPMFISSGLSGVLGMSLLLIGADAESPEERTAERREEELRAEHAAQVKVAQEAKPARKVKKGKRAKPWRAPRALRPGLLASGIVTLVGGTATAIGSFIGLAKGDLGTGGLILGISHLGAAVGVGIPLTVAGAPRRRKGTPPPPPPEVSVGPGTVQLTLTF